MGRPGIVTLEPAALPEAELLARIYRTLGDATRLRIVEVLLEMEEASQTDLIAAVRMTQSRASEHLQCLEWCGFVRSRRCGREVRYSLCDPHAERFLRLGRSFLYSAAQAVGGATVLERNSRRRGGT